MFEFSTALIAEMLSKHRQELQRFLLRRTGCPETAQDILQMLYLRLHGYRSEQVIENPRAFLFRVATNLASDHQRSQERRPDVPLADDDLENIPQTAPEPEAIVLSQQQLALLKQAVSELPPKCREVFMLCKFEQYSYPQVAKLLGISESAVNKHMIKALEYCKRRVYQDL